MDQSNNLATSQELYQQGNQFYQSKDYQQAIECYNTALQLDSQNYKALFSKGNILKEMQNYNEAIECYDEALQYAPNEASIYFNKGNTLQVQGKFNEALQCYEIAIKNNPKERKFYINKGNILRAINRNEEAIQCYDKAIQINPQDPLPISNKGNALFALNRIEEAIQCYEAAIQKNPKYADAYSHKGVALKAQNKNDQALDCFNIAIQKNPKNILSYCNRAMLYLKIQNETSALDDLNKAYELAQDESNLASLNEQNVAYVNKAINEEKIKLIGEVVSLQQSALKIEQKLQSSQQNEKTGETPGRNLLQNFKLKLSEAVKQTLEVVIKESNQQEIAQLKNDMIELKKQMQQQSSQISKKANKSEIEIVAFKVSQEIEQNENLKNYFDALYNKLHQAVQEACLVCGEKLEVSKGNIGISFLSQALNFIPIVGNLVSAGVEGTLKTYEVNKTKQDAAQIIKNLYINPQEREGLIKKTAEKITLNKQKSILNAAQDSEVLKWKDKGWLTKCKDCLIKDSNQQLYSSEVQILACIDAMKIVHAISSGLLNKSNNFEQKIQVLTSVPEQFTFKGQDNIELIEKGISQQSTNSQNQNQVAQNTNVTINQQQRRNKFPCCCLIYSHYDIVYSNPLLNSVYLQKQLSAMTKLTISKVLKHSFRLQEMGYNISDLDLESAACLIISLDQRNQDFQLFHLKLFKQIYLKQQIPL